MLKSIKKRLGDDCRSVLYGILMSILLLTILAVWRVFDTNTFLFIQIVIATFFLYVISIFIPFSLVLSKSVGRELLVVLIAFTVVSTLLLNVDRSRSVFLVKWVYEYSKESPITVDELISKKELSVSEGLSIKQRIGEQGQMSFIKNQDSRLQVTFAGRLFIKVAGLSAKLLNLKGYQSA